MVKAYVMARVDAGKDKEILEKIKMLNGVEDAHATYGIYDLIIQVYFRSIEALDKFVFNDLRKISSVKETVTLVCSTYVT
jgi:DNA-binding Lrp family transcriptional regulator